jgi:hypothetical protein
VTMGKIELRAECVRLRMEERLSLREIHDRTGASKGSLSAWLKDVPLTFDEKSKKLKERRTYIPPKKDRGEESELHRIVRSSNLNGNKVAKVSEAAVMLKMLVRGFNVFGSMFDGEKADWIVETKVGRILKIQVKTTTRGLHGLPFVNLTRGVNNGCKIQVRNRYVKGDFDFMVGYDLFTDVAYVWSWDDVDHLKSAVSICDDAKERWDKFGE